MMPHSFHEFELAKTQQQALHQAGELARRAQEATAERPQRAAHALGRLGSLLGALALWLKGRK